MTEVTEVTDAGIFERSIGPESLGTCPAMVAAVASASAGQRSGVRSRKVCLRLRRSKVSPGAGRKWTVLTVRTNRRSSWSKPGLGSDVFYEVGFKG